MILSKAILVFVSFLGGLDADTIKQAQSGGPQKPAILIYWLPGLTPQAVEPEIATAVWVDGRVVWRDPSPKWTQLGEKWSVKPGKFYEGRISGEAIQAALAKLKAGGVFQRGNWFYTVPDAESTMVVVRSGGKVVQMGVWQELPSQAPHGYNPADWNRGVQAWRLTLRTVAALRPKKGVEVKRPSLTELR